MPAPRGTTSSDHVLIRPERPEDEPIVSALLRAAFGGDEEVDLVARLRPSPSFIPELSLVAEVEGDVRGYLLFTRARIVAPGRDEPVLALAPMAVQPGWQRQGIGAALIRHGLAAARQLGHRLVVVLGHAAYYPRFGFEPAGRFGVRCPLDVPPEAFMIAALVPGATDSVAGIVGYAPEFGIG